MNKQLLLDQLHAGPITVSFIKVNGDRRDMLCTLNEELLPPKPETTTDKPTRKENPDVQSVWDLDAKGWRSFRWENVIGDEDGN